MCDVTLVALSVTVIGSLIQANSQYEAGQQDRQLGQANARFAELAAGDARQRGESEAGRIRMATSRMAGQQRVGAAVSGVDGKSTEDLMADTRMMGELDAQTTRNNAAREAWGYTVQASQQRRYGAQAASRGANQAAGTILGTFAQSLSMSSRK